MRTSVVVSCLVLALIAASALAQDWAYTVTYSDKDCSKWVSYSAVSIPKGCMKVTETTSVKVDCSALSAQLCQSADCSGNCVNYDQFDGSKYKSCAAVTSGGYAKAFCGGLSSPFAGESQAQLRFYGPSNPNNTCTSRMNIATGIALDQCVSISIPQGPNPGTFFGKISCKDNKVSAVACTDNTCGTCQEAQLPTDCLNGIKVACGVGSASGVFVSFAMLALGTIVSMIALF